MAQIQIGNSCASNCGGKHCLGLKVQGSAAPLKQFQQSRSFSGAEVDQKIESFIFAAYGAMKNTGSC